MIISLYARDFAGTVTRGSDSRYWSVKLDSRYGGHSFKVGYEYTNSKGLETVSLKLEELLPGRNFELIVSPKGNGYLLVEVD